MHDAHEALICIGKKTYLNDKNRVTFSNQHYLKSSDEMNKLFSDLPEALENNYNLPLRCSFRTLPSKPILPNISTENSQFTIVGFHFIKVSSLNKRVRPPNKTRIIINHKMSQARYLQAIARSPRLTIGMTLPLIEELLGSPHERVISDKMMEKPITIIF